MKSRVQTTVLGLALVGTMSFADLAPQDYAHHIEFAVSDAGQAALGTASVTDGIPLLVRLSPSIQNFSYSDFQSANGADLLFTDDEGNALPYEVDTWNPQGESLVWVKVPALTSDTVFHGYYGGPANTENTASDTWSGYIGVWHMNEADGTAYDATGHELHGVPTGTRSSEMVACSGVVGKARINLPSYSGSAWLTVPSYTAFNSDASHFTVSGWFLLTDSAGSPRPLNRKEYYSDKNGWDIQVKTGNVLGVRGGSDKKAEKTLSGSLVNTWAYLTFVYNGSTAEIYVDGVSCGSGSIAAATDNKHTLAIGNVAGTKETQCWVGCYDEVRLGTGVYAADRILADYLTASDPGFLSVVDQIMDASTPDFDPPVVVRNQDGTYTFSVTMTDGSGSLYAVYDDGTDAVTNLLSASAAPGVYSETPANLVSGKTYAVAAYGESASGAGRFREGAVVYAGDLSVEAVADAHETGLVPGAIRVTRADSAHDLPVSYTVGGTAVADQTYVALSGGAVIPDGSTYADIAVTPLADDLTTADTTVVLALAPGLYGIDADAASATVLVENLIPPPVFEAPSAVRNLDGTYTLSVAVTGGSGALYAIYDDGTLAVTNLLSADVSADTYSEIPANLDADKTYAFSAYGVSPTGAESFQQGSVFYTGSLSIATLTDAREAGLVPGTLRVTRADSASDLTVSYTVSGTAVAGQTYTELPGTVVITNGATFADIVVAPLVDPETDFDSTVVLTLAPGGYGIDATAASATVVIENLVPPVGYNTWVAPGTAGLASDARNWSLGRVPVATDAILLDGRYSSADCEWNAGVNGLPSTVASWTQTGGYAGAAIFDTEFESYPGASFTLFTVAGNVVLDSGIWTHPVSLYQDTGTKAYSIDEMRQLARYRLRVDVGGTLSIGEDGAIDVSEKGYHLQAELKNTDIVNSAHGGSSQWTRGYGNPKCPVDIGYTYRGKYAALAEVKAGGGAAYIVCTGAVTVDGEISADGGGNAKKDGKDPSNGGSAAGSVYLVAPSVSGSGSIHANGTGEKLSGPGGRVAVITETPVDLDTLDIAATSGTSHTSSGFGNGVGTVYLFDSTSTNGTLRVVGANTTRLGADGNTPVTEESDWTFDAVVLGGSGRLSVTDGTTLTLPNGLASVSTTDTSHNDGLVVKKGGTLVIGGVDQTLDGEWTFQSEDPFTFPGNVTLTNSAWLGVIRMDAQGTNYAPTASYTVNGDLTVPAGCSVDAAQLFYKDSRADICGAHGGWSRKRPAGHTNTYGSVFHPNTVGTSQSSRYYGSGALRITVLGTLALDGTINASGYRDNGDRDDPASAGSLDICAGTLAGTGSITANGAEGRGGKVGGGGGGRIAVRLTDPGATIPDTIAISAYGYHGNLLNQAANDYSSSPGTIYLQPAGTPEGRGTLLIKGNGDATITATTPIAAYVDGDPLEAFRSVPVVVTGNAIAEVSAPRLQIATLAVEEGSKIDLVGNTLVVNRATFGNARVAPGTYYAADFAETLPGYVVDTLPAVPVIEPTEENPNPEQPPQPDPGTLVVIGDATVLLIH